MHEKKLQNCMFKCEWKPRHFLHLALHIQQSHKLWKCTSLFSKESSRNFWTCATTLLFGKLEDCHSKRCTSLCFYAPQCLHLCGYCFVTVRLGIFWPFQGQKNTHSFCHQSRQVLKVRLRPKSILIRISNILTCEMSISSAGVVYNKGESALAKLFRLPD